MRYYSAGVCVLNARAALGGTANPNFRRGLRVIDPARVPSIHLESATAFHLLSLASSLHFGAVWY
jgi:hypothetical protein